MLNQREGLSGSLGHQFKFTSDGDVVDYEWLVASVVDDENKFIRLFADKGLTLEFHTCVAQVNKGTIGSQCRLSSTLEETPQIVQHVCHSTDVIPHTLTQ